MDSQQTNSTNQKDDPDSVLPPLQVTSDDPQAITPDTSEKAEASDIPPLTDISAPPTGNESMALIPIPEEAADSDLIEKEWVLKAKQIVEHTAEDPFSQQEELSKIKADYLKKRYNKDLGATS